MSLPLRPLANQRLRLALLSVAALAISAAAWHVLGAEPSPTTEPAIPPAAPFQVTGGTPEQVGRYLILIGGCNDCHTPGYDQDPTVPEDTWLTGVPVGFKGPWGTTYSSNLRLTVDSLTEQGWVAAMRARTTRPPMPWASLQAMSDSDLKAIYAYIKHLGAKGERMPVALPPGEIPTTPYIVFEPVTKNPDQR